MLSQLSIKYRRLALPAAVRRGADPLSTSTVGSGMVVVATPTAPPEPKPCLSRILRPAGECKTEAAVLAAGIGSGLNVEQAAEIANIAAGIVVSKVGSVVTNRDEIIHEVQRRSLRITGSKLLKSDGAIRSSLL